MRILLWSIAILILLILGFSITTAVYVDKYIEEFVGKKLREESINIRGNRYQVKASWIETDILSGNIRLRDISISPSALTSDTLLEPAIGFLKAAGLKVEGIDLLDYYNDGILRIERIEILDPNMGAFFRNPGESSAIGQSLAQQMDISAPEIFVDSILIINGQASVFRIEGEDTIGTFSIENYTSKYTGFHVDSFSPAFDYPFSFQYGSIEGQGLKARLSFYQNLAVDRFSWGTLDSVLGLQQVQIQPTLTAEAYTSKLKYQNDWYAVDIDKVDIAPIDPVDFLDRQAFNLKTISITHLKALFYRDITLPREDLEKMLPVTAISRIPWETKVERLRVQNAFITYNEKFDKEKEPLVFTLDEMDFQTGPLSTGKQSGFTWDVRAKILGQIPFEAKVDFEIVGGIEKFKASGAASNVSFEKLNPLVKALAPVRFSSGMINQLDYSFSADEDTSSGSLDLEYENMKLELIKHQEGEVRSQKLLSFAANTIKKTHNKKGKSNYKTGIIFTRRDKRKSFFNFFWRSIESGLMSSVSAGNHDRKQRRKHMVP